MILLPLLSTLILMGVTTFNNPIWTQSRHLGSRSRFSGFSCVRGRVGIESSWLGGNEKKVICGRYVSSNKNYDSWIPLCSWVMDQAFYTDTDSPSIPNSITPSQATSPMPKGKPILSGDVEPVRTPVSSCQYLVDHQPTTVQHNWNPSASDRRPHRWPQPWPTSTSCWKGNLLCSAKPSRRIPEPWRSHSLHWFCSGSD